LNYARRLLPAWDVAFYRLSTITHAGTSRVPVRERSSSVGRY